MISETKSIKKIENVSDGIYLCIWSGCIAELKIPIVGSLDFDLNGDPMTYNLLEVELNNGIRGISTEIAEIKDGIVYIKEGEFKRIRDDIKYKKEKGIRDRRMYLISQKKIVENKLDHFIDNKTSSLGEKDFFEFMGEVSQLIRLLNNYLQ
jgi:hypothetical protein